MSKLSDVAPLSVPLDTQWPILWKLAERLRELGYTEENVSRAMGLDDHSTRVISAWPAHVRTCRRLAQTDPVGLLSAFFLVEESVEEKTLKDILGADAVDLLRQMEWIGTLNGKLHFRYYLWPLLGAFILTDGHVSNPNHLDQVYALGSDSHSLGRLAPRPRVDLCLDHCTGSGVQAVLHGPHTGRGFGLDINPRALSFAGMNAKWNGQQHVSFVKSDCYQNVTSDNLGLEGPCEFDLITANPPFVPTPEQLSLCRGGGLSGEEVTEKIVRGLPEKLKPDGIFSMITHVPIIQGQPFFERCESWLGKEAQSWSMVVISNHFWSPVAYIMGHQTPVSFDQYGPHMEMWIEAYESVKLVGVTASQIYLFRSRFPWRLERQYSYPNRAVSDQIAPWISSLRQFGPGSPARYQLHPGLERISWVDDHTRAHIEWRPEYRWFQPAPLWIEGAAARVLDKFQTHPEGLTGTQSDAAAMTTLLGNHLVTLTEN